MTEVDYVRQIEAIRGLIGDGELYQVNYTQPLDLQFQGDAATLYRRIAARNPVAHGAFIQDGERTVLSFSPELFVRRDGPRLTTRPMKGTAPRDPDPAEDERLGQALLASEKNRAENLMIVDLLRNDLGRLAEPGSVRVDALFSLERYPTVWTMTSTVSALAPHASLEEVLCALFPCGSITGAPKVAAMRRIRQMETAPRGLYCGSIGWLAPDGDFSLNVAIRTLVLDHTGHGIYSVGGGIVHDSDPAEEWQECHWKARILRA
jgi:para-aminobenzoate synthetase component 1